jgi:two-component system response regulator YesN
MIRLLLVDDDAITRRSISENIPWESLGIFLCYVAKDGYEAIQYVLENPIDLVLSDIRMPLLNGIEMAKEMKAIQSSIRFVFLSGFPEFEYAKEALKLNAFDFITKPISNTKLIAVMQDAVQQIQQENTNQIALSEGIPMMNRNRLIGLTSGGTVNENLAGTSLIKDGAYACLCIISLEYATDAAPTILDLHEVCTKLEALPYCSVATVRIASQIIVLVTDPLSLQETEFLQKIEQTKSLICKIIQHSLKVKMSMVQGSTVTSEAEIADSYNQAIKGTSDSGYVLTEKVKRYLLENLHDSQLSLNSIAQHFLINPCYLTVIFKKYNDCNVYNYLIKLRMEKAAELLRTSELRSYEIASLVGYNDSQYFCNSFRKYYSSTTSDYRKQFMQEKELP